MTNEITAQSYTLKDKNGNWLGQIVLTSDGLFASVTDYGNLSYVWRAYGTDFKEFLMSLNVGYFGGKLYTGMAYILSGRKCELACMKFAEMILPALQEALREEKEAAYSFGCGENNAPEQIFHQHTDGCFNCNNRYEDRYGTVCSPCVRLEVNNWEAIK